MKLPSWMTGKPTAAASARQRRASQTEAPARKTRSSRTDRAPANSVEQAPPEARRTGGTERREQLYAALREALSSVGVLPADYKAKALSVDRSGGQYLVMMDVGAQMGGDAQRLGQLEMLMAQAARTRADLIVTGVYWRIDPQPNAQQDPKATQQATPQVFAALPALAPTGAVEAATVACAAPTLSATAEAKAAAAMAMAMGAKAAPKVPLSVRLREIFAPIDSRDVAAFKRAKARAAGELDHEDSTY